MNVRERLANFQYWPHVTTLVIVFFAFLAYRYFAYYDTRSNDSYVSAHVINIASLVAGPIAKIYVHENQHIKKGDKLVTIDPRPFLYALNKAKADFQIAKIDYQSEKLAIKVAEDELKQSRAILALSEDHLRRYRKLTQHGDLAEIQVINTEAKISEQQSVVLAAMQKVRIAQQNFDDNRIKAAKATMEQAQYLYDHTTIYAPTDGFITNFNVRRGQYIHTGEGLFALVEDKRWWVVTRYRETAIRLIKPGDRAKIYLDMYPGKTFYGHVHSIGWGINRVQAGKVAPSTLVYMEPTEYWIKIAQRFPVRIYFDNPDPNFPLRIGASATTITYPRRD